MFYDISALVGYLMPNALYIYIGSLFNSYYTEVKVLRSHIHEYGHVRNRHVMFINIEHIKNIGISAFENTERLLFRYETFLLTLS